MLYVSTILSTVSVKIKAEERKSINPGTERQIRDVSAGVARPAASVVLMYYPESICTEGTEYRKNNGTNEKTDLFPLAVSAIHRFAGSKTKLVTQGRKTLSRMEHEVRLRGRGTAV
ncbi:hypothetical protein EVAR_2975_1 [Eumeta japonica]|uniref:Uncharacterized protein n=1 Tax=Eumeta variegata TaxID=151549 RepID=A0A4C1SVX3_EUMVA|nr:hypothetical protein EVAR_2975_1 [Eumeta japonica]